MQNYAVAIVILSCDKFKVAWKPCIDHFFNAWPDCPHTVYLLNNFTSSEDHRVKDLMVGEDHNWSDTLKKGLLKIEEKRIFFIFDDSFITKLDFEEVKLIFEMTFEMDLDSVALRRKEFDRGKKFNEKVYRLSPTTKYRNSLFLNLIKKDLLLNLLSSGENAWQFEKDGNVRNKNFDFYSVYERGLISYHHGIIKGKWMPEVYAYLKNKGYSLSENTFENHSKLRVLAMGIYTMIFYTVHKFTHLFK
jgi:hypothetical protein